MYIETLPTSIHPPSLSIPPLLPPSIPPFLPLFYLVISLRYPLAFAHVSNRVAVHNGVANADFVFHAVRYQISSLPLSFSLALFLSFILFYPFLSFLFLFLLAFSDSYMIGDRANSSSPARISWTGSGSRSSTTMCVSQVSLLLSLPPSLPPFLSCSISLFYF